MAQYQGIIAAYYACVEEYKQNYASDPTTVEIGRRLALTVLNSVLEEKGGMTVLIHDDGAVEIVQLVLPNQPD
jgi:hypothetical protein